MDVTDIADVIRERDELKERIAKAREILKDTEPESSCWLCMERKRNIQRALEALEGK